MKAGVSAAFLLAFYSCIAGAQGWPAKPLRLIVPYTAAGSTDQLSRAVAQKLGDALGQPVIVDNRPGANTILGAEAAAKSDPDGYTLFMGSSGSLAVNPSLYKKLPYDPQRDFALITLAASSPLMLVLNPSVPANSVKELVAYAKANPGKLNFASVGNGNPLHLAGELFKAMAGVDMTHVPYKGSAPALTDLLAGQVQLMFDTPITSVPHVKAGKLRALAVTSGKRSRALPDLPTIAELGYPGYDAGIWFGVVTRSGTPAPVLARLNAELRKILDAADLRERFGALALDLMSSSPEDFASFTARETVKWQKVIRDSGTTLD
jgi:tripartite-type tricarboxylate transporter receptor subunit TctC